MFMDFAELLRRIFAQALVFLAILVAGGYAFAANDEVPKIKSVYSKKGWSDDFAFLKENLERYYANLQWFASPQGGVDLPELARRTSELLHNARDDEEAAAAIRLFVQRIHDGHLREVPKVLPILPKLKEPIKPDFKSLTVDQACAAAGFSLVNGDSFSLPFESIKGFSLISSGYENGFRTGIYITEDGKRIGVLRLASFRETDYPAVCRQIWTQLKNEKTELSERAIRAEMSYQWLATLSGAVMSLKQRNAQVLVIDLAGNGGGNDSGDWSTRIFSSKAINSAPLLLVSAVAERYANDQISKLTRSKEVAPGERPDLVQLAEEKLGYFEQGKRISAANCDMSWVWAQQRPWLSNSCGLVRSGFASGAVPFLAKVSDDLVDYTMYIYWPAISDPYQGTWSRNTYVLIDGQTASSAEMFAATMVDNGAARTIGSRTRGSGCGNMMPPKVITLPNSGMRFRIPDCVRLRRDGTDEVAGIEPNIPVEITEGESPRARGARLMALIARDTESE